MNPTPPRAVSTGMLASVNSIEEARHVLEIGVDIIDLKAPAEGALGALPTEQVAQVCAALERRCPVSATIGDRVSSTEVRNAVESMHSTGVDYVKIGFFPETDWPAMIHSLGAVSADIRLIAVLFADQTPGLAYVTELAAAGFSGVMLDTMDKTRGTLLNVYPYESLDWFVRQVKAAGLLCGLAGSLREADIQPLLALAPDYLGFRGALCRHQQRTEALDPAAVQRVQGRIRRGIKMRRISSVR